MFDLLDVAISAQAGRQWPDRSWPGERNPLSRYSSQIPSGDRDTAKPVAECGGDTSNRADPGA